MSQLSLNSKKSKEIHTCYLNIKGNIIECNNLIIQISNVSTFEAINAPSEPFPLYTILALLIAFAVFSISALLSIIIAAIAIAIICKWYIKNNDLKNHRYLFITLNSNEVIRILFTDSSFLEKVLDCIKEILINPESKQEYHINIQGNTIHGGSAINTMNIQ